MLSYLNVNSLTRVFDELKIAMTDGLVDMISIGESKLDEFILDNIVKVKNFKIYRRDVKRNAHGLVTYVRSSIIHMRRLDLELENSNSQYIVIELRLRKEKWFVISVYKPPPVKDDVFMSELSQICDYIYRESDNVILIGDMNINMNVEGNVLSDLCTIYDMKNLVKEPTCFKSQLNPSLIDVILVAKPKRFYPSLIFDTGLSDFHKMICVCTKMYAPQDVQKKIVYRSFKNFDEELYKADVAMTPFHIAYIFDDIDDVVWCHNKMLSDVIESHAPLKHRTLKKESVPYMNSKLRKVQYRRNQLRNKYWNNKNATTWEEYRKMRNKANIIRKQSEKTFFKKKCLNNDNQREFWKTFKPYLSSKCITMDNIILKENERIVNNPTEVCELFRQHFSSIAESIGEPDHFEGDITDAYIYQAINTYQNHPSIVEINNQHPSPETFNFNKTEENKVLHNLRNVNIKKSTGYDNISPCFIKMAANELAHPITQVINLCIAHSHYPECYKRSETAPVYKAKDMYCKDNYRPVSCLTTVSKIIEYEMCDQTNYHFADVFDDRLSAFRKGIGCEQVLVKVTEQWKNALDNGMIVGTVLMDLSKAFDCLPHKLLISKLYAYGFSISACRFIASYLTDRKMRVKHFGSKSQWSIITKGIPQGSIMGPVIFNIFINDLLTIVQCNIYNYADDNTIAQIEMDLNILMSELENKAGICIEWFDNNMMKANAHKFQFMLCDRKNRCPENTQLVVRGNCLSRKKTAKLLGLNIDDQLSFDIHVTNLCKKASRNINILLRLSGKIGDLKERLALLDAFLCSIFTYCPTVWHFCSKKVERIMEKIHERGLKFVLNDASKTYEELLIMTNCDTMTLWRLKKIALFMYKCFYKLHPNYINEMFKAKDSMYSMRDNLKFELYKFKTKRYGYKSLMYAGTKLWNSLPVSLKESNSINDFKVKLNGWKCNSTSCDKCQDFMYHM